MLTCPNITILHSNYDYFDILKTGDNKQEDENKVGEIQNLKSNKDDENNKNKDENKRDYFRYEKKAIRLKISHLLGAINSFNSQSNLAIILVGVLFSSYKDTEEELRR